MNLFLGVLRIALEYLPQGGIPQALPGIQLGVQTGIQFWYTVYIGIQFVWGKKFH